MEKKASERSRNSWMIVGVLATVVALGVLVGARRWHSPEYQAPTVEKPQIQNKQTAKPAKRESRASIETTPDQTLTALVRAWNQGDAADLADMFASNGVLIIPAGSQIQSRAEIEKTMREKRAGLLRDTKLTNTVEEVTQDDGENATIRGTYRLDGIKILGLNQSAAGTYVLHQVKREGRWLISRAEFTKGGEG